MTMLDETRGRALLAKRAGVTVAEVRDLVIWGNHSSTQFPDAFHATIGGRAAAEVINDDAWLRGEFITTVQQRGAAIIAARGLSSAASAANAVVETVRNVAAPTGQIFSAAVRSPGEEDGYGVPEGLVFGFPLRGTDAGRGRDRAGHQPRRLGGGADRRDAGRAHRGARRGGSAGRMSTDGRTGGETLTRPASASVQAGDRSAELPIVEGTEGDAAIDIGQLRADTGLVTFDPGYKNTAASMLRHHLPRWRGWRPPLPRATRSSRSRRGPASSRPRTS